MRVLRISHSSVVGSWRDRERALRSLGIDCETLTSIRWEEGGRVVELAPFPGEPVSGVRTWGHHPCGFLYSPLGLWSQLRRGWDLLDIQEEPYSLAAAEILLLRLLARSKARVVIYSAQNLDKHRSPLVRASERIVLRATAGAYPCSRGAAAVLRQHGFQGVTRTIPLGVEETVSASAVPHRGERPAAPRVGFLGRLVPEKGVDVLLEAAARFLPEWEVRIAGDGPQRGALQASARHLFGPGRVRFDGALEDGQVPGWFSEIDVLAVPSLPRPNWTEQFGRVAVEAMAAGVPVVASDTGALPEVVADAGLLVAPGDPAALAGALRSLQEDPTLRARIIARGRARARSCSWQAVATLQRQLYHSVLGPLPRATLDTMYRPPLAVIVVAYGREDLLARSLAALADPDDRLQVVVVDNSSSQAVRRVAEAAGVGYDDPGANLGFSAAVNRALQRIDGTVDVLLLNPDAEIDVPTLRALQIRLHAESRLAAVAPAQVDPTGSEQRVGWPFPSPAGAWLEALGLGRRSQKVDFLVGSVLLISGEAIAEVGDFDERYFLYAEEVDWQRRARDAGWGVRLCPELTAAHVGGGTLQADPERREALFCAGVEKYIRTWYGSGGWQAFRSGVVIGALARAVLLPARAEDSFRRARRYASGPIRSLARGEP